LRLFGKARRSVPKGVGGLFADAYFPTVAKIQHVPDDGYDLVEVQHDVRESVVCSHFLLPFIRLLW